VHYNIGAAAYRAGDLPRAERAFREVARTPSMAALAHYNLGLVALDRRDPEEARAWFERATQEGPDERLMMLATRRLDELPRSRVAGGWSWYARGGAGHDDNIALRSDSIDSSASGEQDSFAELTAAASYSLGMWRFDAGAGMLEYSNLDDFSQRSLYLGAARTFRLDHWYLELGAYGSQLTFGGEVFERDTAGGLRATRLFPGGSRLRAQLRAASVEGKGEFSGLTGDRMELGLYYDKSWRAWYFAVHTRGERNDSEDPVFATRWLQVGAEARYSLSPAWAFSLGAALRRTNHDAQNETVAGWDDDRVSLQVGATRALWKQAQLFVRYDHEANDSPVAGYDYDRKRVSASIEFWY
jgi:tetratricopeptide (TPR) repeat protein